MDTRQRRIDWTEDQRGYRLQKEQGTEQKFTMSNLSTSGEIGHRGTDPSSNYGT